MRISLRHYLSQRLADPDREYRRLNWYGLRGMVFSEMPSPEMVVRRVVCPAPAVRILKDSRSVMAMLCQDEIRKDGYFYKCYNYRDFWHNLRKIFRFPRPYRCLAAAIKLQSLGINTPRVLFAGEVLSWGFWPRRQYFLSEQLPDGFHFLPSQLHGSLERRLALVRKTVSEVAGWHDHGVEHGDLSFRNIYCRDSGDGQFCDFGLIDLDGCRIYSGAVPNARRERELARVISSAYRVRTEYGAGDVMPLEELITECMTVYRDTCGIAFPAWRLEERCRRFLRHRGHRRNR